MPSDKQSQTAPIVQGASMTCMAKHADPSQVNSPKQSLPSAATSKITMDWVKSHVITTSKLMKQLEMATLERESTKTQTSRLTETLVSSTAENTRLKQELLSTRATILAMQQKLSHVDDGLGDSTSMISSMQNSAALAWQQSTLAKDLLASREMYIKQMEAQVENLEANLLAPDDDQPRKKRRRNSTLLERREKQIEELQQQLATIRENQTYIQEHKADTEASYNALQKDHQKLKQQLETQQELHRSEFVNMEQQQRQIYKDFYQQQQQQLRTNTGTASFDEMEDLRQKLQQNNTSIKYLKYEAERLRSVDDRTHFIKKFKQCLTENEINKKEKRILQDKLTELLLINESNGNSRHLSLLPQHRLAKLSPLGHCDAYDSGEQLPTMAEQNPTHHDTHQPPLNESASDQHSPYEQHSNHHTQSLVTHNCKSKDGMDDNGTQRNVLHSTTTLNMEKLTKQQDSTTESNDISDLPSSSSYVSSSSSSSSSTASSSSFWNSSSSTDTEAEADPKHLPSLSDLAFGTQKKISVKPTPTQGRMERTKSRRSNSPSKLPLTSTEYNSLCDDRHYHATILHASDIAKKSPADIHTSLLCKQSFDGLQMDTLLASLNTLYQKWKTPAVPIDKLKSGLQATTDVSSHGVETQSKMINGCPKYFTMQEKNIAWALWVLISHYPKNGHYSKVVKWATYNALTGLMEVRGKLACRYIRLMVLLCKNANDKKWVLHFCCDLVRQSPKDANIMSPLLNIALTWPGILTLGAADESNLVTRTIQHCCAHYCKSNQPANKGGVIYAYMVPLANWPELEQTTSLINHIHTLKRTLTSLHFRDLYDTNRNAFDDLRSNLVKSLDISYWRLNDWNAVYHGFILADLWPLMNDKALSFTSIELIGLLARCGLPRPESKKPAKPGVALIQHTFMDLLENGNDCVTNDFSSQCLLANYLVWMAQRNLGIGDVVVRWYDDLKPPLVNRVASDLVVGIEGLRSRQ